MKLKTNLLLALTFAALTIGAGAKEQPAGAHLVGTWDTKGTAPNGDVRDSILKIEIKDDKLHCTSSGERGEMELDSITVDGKKIIIEKKFERNGNAGSLKVEATEKSPGKLEGTWSIETAGGDKISGAWEAIQRRTIDLTGNWLASALSENGGDPYPFILEFKGSAKDLSATSTTDRGTTQLEEVKFDDRSLSFVSKVKFEDNSFTIPATADVQEDGSLAGTYQTKQADGTVVDKGTWTAVREKNQAGAPDVSGDWRTTVNYGEESRDYGLKISKTEKGLEAVAIDQEGTEHPCKSATFKDGQLTISTSVEYEGADVEIRYEAKLGDDGKLNGKFYAVGYEEQFKGTWSGARK